MTLDDARDELRAIAAWARLGGGREIRHSSLNARITFLSSEPLYRRLEDLATRIRAARLRCSCPGAAPIVGVNLDLAEPLCRQCAWRGERWETWGLMMKGEQQKPLPRPRHIPFAVHGQAPPRLRPRLALAILRALGVAP